MDALAPFRIPAATLKADEATYNWELGPEFLAIFDDEHEAVKGLFSVDMNLFRSGGMVHLEFLINGLVDTICDRCSVAIEMPVYAEYQLLVKYGDPADSTDEVVFVDQDAPDFNAGKHIYDFIMLAIPISQRIPDCETMENSPCDRTVLSYLAENPIDENTPRDKDSPWDDLKNVIEN